MAPSTSRVSRAWGSIKGWFTRFLGRKDVVVFQPSESVLENVEEKENKVVKAGPEAEWVTVGFLGSVGPMLEFQSMAMQTTCGNWTLTVKSPAILNGHGTISVACFQSVVYFANFPQLKWSTTRFHATSYYFKQICMTSLLTLKRVTKLDNHLVVDKILPYLEDYFALEAESVRLAVEAIEPYPNMALYLKIDDRWNTNKVVLSRDEHAFAVKVRFGSNEAVKHMVLREDNLFDH